MESVEVDESLIMAANWKLHGEICKQLYAVVHKVLGVFPVLEAARPGSSSGIQALCSLHIAVEKAKNLLQHCSECSRLYLAITAHSILIKFEKSRSSLLESLHYVEETMAEAITCQIPEIIRELEEAVFALDQSEKQSGDDVIQLFQNEKTSKNASLDKNELEIFHQAALKVGITSSRAALTERRALKRLLERARAEEDKRKESITSYLLQLMRKYSKLFRSETVDDTDSQGSAPCSPTMPDSNCSTPCSPTVPDSKEDVKRNDQAFEKQQMPKLTSFKLSSFNLKQNKMLSGSMPIPPEELRCPISLQIMYDPVVISSGQTYERSCIEKWFNNGNRTCPKTRQQLFQLSLTPNYCVKGLITSWCEQNKVPLPSGPPESPKLNYWKLALSENNPSESRYAESNKSPATNGVEGVPFKESGVTNEVKTDGKAILLENDTCRGSEMDVSRKYESWLATLSEGKSMDEKRKAAEHIRYLLKDDEELRTYMGANGFAEALVQFLKMAVCEGDDKALEAGAMALFNLAVNNNRNKKMLLSAGVIPLVVEMIEKSETCEAASALYLNLSCLDEAKPIIGSSQAIPFLIKCLQDDGSGSSTCRLDALYALYNLSTHAPNAPFLISSGIVDSLYPLLTACSAWADKALAVFINLALNRLGKKAIASNPAVIGAIVLVLDNGEPIEQEKAASCLWIVCNGDESCSYAVLQEGAIPALVSLAANGTPRAKEKAQKLLKLFRDQRQRELEQAQPQVQLHEVSQAVTQHQEVHSAETTGDKRSSEIKPDKRLSEMKPLRRSKSKRFGRAFICILKTNILSRHRD